MAGPLGQQNEKEKRVERNRRGIENSLRLPFRIETPLVPEPRGNRANDERVSGQHTKFAGSSTPFAIARFIGSVLKLGTDDQIS